MQRGGSPTCFDQCSWLLRMGVKAVESSARRGVFWENGWSSYMVKITLTPLDLGY